MTTWQMKNYQKMEKDRQKRAKTKGPMVNTKGSSHKASKKFRGGNTLFSKKRYKIGHLGGNAAKYVTLRMTEYAYLKVE